MVTDRPRLLVVSTMHYTQTSVKMLHNRNMIQPHKNERKTMLKQNKPTKKCEMER